MAGPAVRCLLPFEGPLLPGVTEAGAQDDDEDDHRVEGSLTDRPGQGKSPGEEEDCLDVEDEEKDGVHVVANVDSRADMAYREHAAFVWRALLAGGGEWREDLAADDGRKHHDGAEAGGHQDGKVVVEKRLHSLLPC